MAQSFETRILDRVGEPLTGDIGLDTEMLDDWCTLGVRDIIMRMPSSKLEDFVVQSTVFAPDMGVELTTKKIAYVTRNDGNIDRNCRKIKTFLSGRASDSQDILYATANDPVYYWEPQTSGDQRLKILPASSSNIGKAYHVFFPTVDASADTEISGFPDELEPYVELYAVAQVKLREAGKLRRSSQDELEAITTSGYLASFESALPTYSAPAVPVLPAFTSLAAMTNAIPTYQDVTWNASFSDSISTKAVPVYTAPAAFTYDTTYTANALEMAEDLLNDTDGSSSWVASADFDTVALTDEDIEKADIILKGAAQEINLAQTAIQEEIAQLREYEAEVTESLGLFTAEIDSYRAQFQEDIETYRQSLEKYKVDLKKDVDTYAQENGMDVTIFRAELEKVIQDFTAQTNFEISEATAYINEYNSLVKGEVGDFQANLAKARSYLEEAGVRLQTMQSLIEKDRWLLQNI